MNLYTRTIDLILLIVLDPTVLGCSFSTFSFELATWNWIIYQIKLFVNNNLISMHMTACQCVKLQLAKLGLDSEFARKLIFIFWLARLCMNQLIDFLTLRTIQRASILIDAMC